ncbi:uncharacterized protein LOC120534120 isoform X2 [Polypterus senegalus]|uniref:uncharacterized protein LOC120534120 isoform X2 n=1 Tax=Polypterus senegalus TaxID=55291 RepID=UPI001964AA00|nr:uncharacterized protein LOC120534120 isoform X2 [Polypterus senegalus]
MILTFFLCLLTLNCSLVCPRGIDTASLKRSTTEDANIDEHLQGKNETILNATQVDLPERNMTLDNSTCVFNNTKSEQENGNYTDIDEHLQGKNETILNATQVDLPERNMTLNNSTCVFNNIKSEQDNGNYPDVNNTETGGHNQNYSQPNKLMLQRFFSKDVIYQLAPQIILYMQLLEVQMKMLARLRLIPMDSGNVNDTISTAS